MKITLSLRASRSNNIGPNIRVFINDKLVGTVMNMFEEKLLEFNITEPRKIVLEHFGKSHKDISDGEDIAFTIEEIRFDGIQVHDDILFNQWLYPDNEDYEPITNNCYIGHTGKWVMDIPEDINAWLINPYYHDDFPINKI